jgi:hypothetical protein
MSLFRRLRAWVALVTFAATFGFGVVTVGHFGPEDDAACGQVGLVDGHPRTQFEAVKLSGPATHCPFCHWQRVVSGANLASVTTALFPLERLARVIPSASRVGGSDVLDSRLSRGPPAQL